MAFEISRRLDCKKRPVYHIEREGRFAPALRTFLSLFGPVAWHDFGLRTLVKMDVPGRFHLSAALGGPEGVKVTFRDEGAELLPAVYQAVWLSQGGCDACADCLPACPEGVLSLDGGRLMLADGCSHCLACLAACPQQPDLPEILDD